MSLLAMLLALAAEKLFAPQRDAALAGGRLQSLLRRYLPALPRSSFLVILATLAPAFLAQALEEELQRALGAPLRLLFDAAVLFACLGPKAPAAGASTEARPLPGSLFIEAHEHLFGVLWWFILGGPAGAALYRASREVSNFCARDPDASGAGTAASLHALLAWLPARLTAALFALAGSMDDALGEWRRLRGTAYTDWRARTWTVLTEVAGAALDWEEGDSGPAVAASLETLLEEIRRMQLRALLILLAVAALASAGSWLA